MGLRQRAGWAFAVILSTGLILLPVLFSGCAARGRSRHYAIRGKGKFKPRGCGCNKLTDRAPEWVWDEAARLQPVPYHPELED